MKLLKNKTLDVAIVISMAVAVYKITKIVTDTVWLNAYQSDSYALTTMLTKTTWLFSAIPYIVSLLIGVLVANNLNSKRSLYIVFIGIIAILMLSLNIQSSCIIEAQSYVIPLNNTVSEVGSPPTRLQCFASTNGNMVEELIFDGDDILKTKPYVSQYDETNLLHLQLIESASGRLHKATSPPTGSFRWLVFTTNYVFFTNSVIEEPIINGSIYLPMESKAAAQNLANGIHNYLYQ